MTCVWVVHEAAWVEVHAGLCVCACLSHRGDFVNVENYLSRTRKTVAGKWVPAASEYASKATFVSKYICLNSQLCLNTKMHLVFIHISIMTMRQFDTLPLSYMYENYHQIKYVINEHPPKEDGASPGNPCLHSAKEVSRHI